MVPCLVAYLRAVAVMFLRGADAAQPGSSSPHHVCDAVFILMQKAIIRDSWMLLSRFKRPGKSGKCGRDRVPERVML